MAFLILLNLYYGKQPFIIMCLSPYYIESIHRLSRHFTYNQKSQPHGRKVIWIHPLGTMDICAMFRGNPSKGC